MLDITEKKKRQYLDLKQAVDLEKLISRHLTVFPAEPGYDPGPRFAKTTCRYHAGYDDERIRDLYRDPKVNTDHVKRIREKLFGRFHPESGDISLLIAKIAQLEERVSRLEYHQQPHSPPLLIEAKPSKANSTSSPRTTFRK